MHRAKKWETATYRQGRKWSVVHETGWSPNGRLMQLKPEDIAALTDAPLLTDDCTIEDDSSVTVNGRVWWFPGYMVTNFMTDLENTGSVIFQAAAEVA